MSSVLTWNGDGTPRHGDLTYGISQAAIYAVRWRAGNRRPVSPHRCKSELSIEASGDDHDASTVACHLDDGHVGEHRATYNAEAWSHGEHGYVMRQIVITWAEVAPPVAP